MKNKILLAFMGIFALGILYFAYHSFVEEAIQEEIVSLRISTPLTSIAYFIEQIGGDHVKVQALLPADQDYHTLELSPPQVKRLNEGDAFFTISTIEEAPLVEKLEAKEVKVFDISQGIFLLPFEEDNHHEHVGHDHNHTGWDPHLWLSVSNMSLLSENIASVLSELDPKNTQTYQDNLRDLQVRLQALWQNISEVLSNHENSQILVMHASYAYFLDPFHIKQISLESFQGESSLKQLGTALSAIKDSGARFLLVQSQYNPEQAHRLSEETGSTIIVFNPVYKDPFKELPLVLEAIQGAGER